VERNVKSYLTVQNISAVRTVMKDSVILVATNILQPAIVVKTIMLLIVLRQVTNVMMFVGRRLTVVIILVLKDAIKDLVRLVQGNHRW
jgi:hypothetical protein